MIKKLQRPSLATGALVLAATAVVYGQQSAIVVSEPSAGLANDWLRRQSETFKPWDIGGQFRVRLEHKEHFAMPGGPGAPVDFQRTGGDTDNTYWLFREKVHVGYAPCPWVTAFAEGRDSFSVQDERNPNPESDRLDLHQAYVGLGNAKEFPLVLKVGRQELSYGDERVVGAFDWNNIGRVFDAAKLRYEAKDLWVDGFVGRVVVPDDHNLNLPNDYDYFSGLYASTKTLLPQQETQLYFLARNVGLDSPQAQSGPPLTNPRDIYTLGLRVKSLPGQLKGFDYSAELAGQRGYFKETAAGPNLDQEAFAVHLAAGYTFKDATAKPRVGLEYNFASGDDNAGDGRHQTFENLFPTNHKFYGYMDFLSWQNLHNPRLNVTLKPAPKLTVTADYHLFWLAETGDYVYQVNGSPRRRVAGTYGINPGYDSYLGSELDLVATYAIQPYATAQIGYGHFFVGDYIRSSLAAAGGATDADYLYVQLVLNF